MDLLSSFWFFPASIIGFVISLTILYQGHKLITSTYNKYKRRKLESKSISDCFDHYYCWQPGDELWIGLNDHNDESRTLVAYSDKQVVVRDNMGNEDVVCPAVIKSNKTAEIRIAKARAKQFHEDVIKTLREADLYKALPEHKPEES